jgi:hypothetical protein
MGLIQDWILPATIGCRRKQGHGRGDPGLPCRASLRATMTEELAVTDWAYGRSYLGEGA